MRGQVEEERKTLPCKEPMEWPNMKRNNTSYERKPVITIGFRLCLRILEPYNLLGNF